LMDKTIFILTSDHGEELYEHGRIDHGHSLYDELIYIPLIITVPGASKSIPINAQVRSIDLMPTIFDLIDLPVSGTLKDQFSGVSLVPLMKGENFFLDAFSETDYRYSVFLRSLRTADGWKFIMNQKTQGKEFYQLHEDPLEKSNISGEKKPIEANVESRLRAILERVANKFL